MKAFIGVLVIIGICLGLATPIALIVSKVVGLGSGASDVGDVGCCGSIFLIAVALVLNKANKS